MRLAKRALLLILPAFLAGIISGYFVSRIQGQTHDFSILPAENARLTAALQKAESQNTALQSQLTRIVAVDFADYQRLQNEEAQYLKAKQILGKVFLVLFHNLLSDIPKDQLDLAQTLADTGQGHSASDVVETTAPSPNAATEVSSVPHSAVAPESSVKTDVVAGWALAEKDLAQVNPDKAEAFLQAAVIPDIMREQGNARFSSQDTRLQAMQGFYSGELVFLDPKRKPSSMDMSLTSEVRNGVQQGEFVIRLVDENGVMSRLREDSDIGAIFKPVSSSKALIVRVDKTEFLQFYIFENQGIILGNYYNKDKSGKVIHLGSFRLQR
jgi:hypothetical protein